MVQQDGFFITANDGVEMQAQDEGEEDAEAKEYTRPGEDGYGQEYEGQEDQEVDGSDLREQSADEFGKWKMDKFKAFARSVLVNPLITAAQT